MANNRIFLRCKNCGKGLFLGKSFGCEYMTWQTKENELVDSLNDFFEEHCFCEHTPEETKNYIDLEPKFKQEKTHYENRFEIAYEIMREEDE